MTGAEVDDMKGESDMLFGARSEFHGSEPEMIQCRDSGDETARLVEGITNRGSVTPPEKLYGSHHVDGGQGHDGIFAPSGYPGTVPSLGLGSKPTGMEPS
jgi:hypothetical protein